MGLPSAPGSTIVATCAKPGRRYRASAAGLYPDSTTAMRSPFGDNAMPCGIVPVRTTGPRGGLSTHPLGSIATGATGTSAALPSKPWMRSKTMAAIAENAASLRGPSLER